ncbi:iron ABC transporter substrate-binding protein [Endozoicomonas montiporae]|uniref:Iron ABC transporter substrate-binding protein n=2 Tax=Endozoicomonas montiporae TaxID=1027273 RepID=A0A081N048_9GAMM|nr:Fe(3+) ABC transporter substrate-binding protein [Endozoicomonas montiporae]AMO58837.1 iron(III) transport system substrate-binding protein [Endozoicomonas montiporae CL-33]KEQ11821.1 iron ABC transporter substrate-binding protein [Endozoicomonas montiporae]
MKLIQSILLTAAVAATASVTSAKEVNVYSYRQPFLVEPLFEEFTKETGIPVKVVFADKGLTERLQREGRLSPADVVLTTDISRLMELVDRDLSQPVDSNALEDTIPDQFRDPDGQWFALTKRVRNIYTTRRDGKPESISYDDLADPEFKGKICTRSGKNAYNVGLVASYVANYGEEKTIEWLEGFKSNLARRPQGNDRAQVRAVSEGVCDLALGNSYYYGAMLKDAGQREWAESVYINFPDQDGKGSHVNVSGMVLTRHAPNKESAVKLMEYLASDKAQAAYAEVNMEYPVNPSVPVSELVASWGEFKADDLPISKLAENYSTALRLLDEVRFDL